MEEDNQNSANAERVKAPAQRLKDPQAVKAEKTSAAARKD